MYRNWLLALLASFSCVSWASAELGRLVIVGGGGTPQSVLKRVVGFAGGADCNAVVLPQASQSENRGKDILSAFQQLGVAQVEIVELDEQAKNKINSADLIWFSGGQQSRLKKALDAAGLSEVIRQRRLAGTTIGGTSAGAAVMSEVMITALPERAALRDGNTPQMKGLGLAPELIIDQHFVERRRLSRLLSAVLQHPDHVGVGIGEQTAIVASNGALEVMGTGSVVIIDARNATVGSTKQGELQSAKNLQVHVLKAGQTFQYRTAP